MMFTLQCEKYYLQHVSALSSVNLAIYILFGIYFHWLIMYFMWKHI